MFFLVSVACNCLKVVLASLYDQNSPLCPEVLNSNVMLAQPLRLEIPQRFTRRSLSGVWRLYIHARKKKPLRSDVDRLTLTKHCKFILHSLLIRKHASLKTGKKQPA